MNTHATPYKPLPEGFYAIPVYTRDGSLDLEVFGPLDTMNAAIMWAKKYPGHEQLVDIRITTRADVTNCIYDVLGTIPGDIIGVAKPDRVYDSFRARHWFVMPDYTYTTTQPAEAMPNVRCWTCDKNVLEGVFDAQGHYVHAECAPTIPTVRRIIPVDEIIGPDAGRIVRDMFDAVQQSDEPVAIPG